MPGVSDGGRGNGARTPRAAAAAASQVGAVAVRVAVRATRRAESEPLKTQTLRSGKTGADAEW